MPGFTFPLWGEVEPPRVNEGGAGEGRHRRFGLGWETTSPPFQVASI
jgi:hypothetical protein